MEKHLSEECVPHALQNTRHEGGKGTNDAKETRQLKATWDRADWWAFSLSQKEPGTLEKRICKVDKCYFENYAVENDPLFFFLIIYIELSKDYSAGCLQPALKKFSLGEHRMVSMSLRPA